MELRSGSSLWQSKRLTGTETSTSGSSPFGADYQGQISARWRGYLPAGTPLRTADGDATLVLAGALEYPALDSTPVDVTKPNAWQNTLLFLCSHRGLPVGLPLSRRLLRCPDRAAFGVLGRVIDRIKAERTGTDSRPTGPASSAAACLAFGGLYVGAWNASRILCSGWTSSDDIAGAELPISDVSAASEATFTVHNNNNEPNNGSPRRAQSTALRGRRWRSVDTPDRCCYCACHGQPKHR